MTCIAIQKLIESICVEVGGILYLSSENKVPISVLSVPEIANLLLVNCVVDTWDAIATIYINMYYENPRL